jgi:nitrate reductase NapE component
MTEENNKVISNKIIKIFDELPYSEDYNFDIWITIIAFIITIFIAGYFYIKNKIRVQKTNWDDEKCNPLFMPFADIIKNNDSSKSETIDNFKECLNNVNYGIAMEVKNPIDAVMNIMLSIFGVLATGFSGVVNFITYLFSIIIKLFSVILEHLKVIVDNVRVQFIYIENFFQSIIGIIADIYYTLTILIDSIKLSISVVSLAILSGIVVPSIATLGTIIVLTFIYGILARALGWIFPSFWFIFSIMLILLIVSLIFSAIVTYLWTYLSSFNQELICQINNCCDTNSNGYIPEDNRSDAINSFCEKTFNN